MTDALKARIRHVPDFPKTGILFYDITTLLRDPEGFRIAIDRIAAPFSGERIDLVVGIESRGFILGSAVADRLGAGFVPDGRVAVAQLLCVHCDLVDLLRGHATSVAPGTATGNSRQGMTRRRPSGSAAPGPGGPGHPDREQPVVHSRGQRMFRVKFTERPAQLLLQLLQLVCRGVDALSVKIEGEDFRRLFNPSNKSWWRWRRLCACPTPITCARLKN